MATPAISIPTSPSRSSSGPDRLLPVAGMAVAVAAVTALTLAVAGLPEAAPAGSPMAPEVVVTVTAPHAIDRVDGVLPGALPRSDRPVGGLVFVRCTTLWVANADGSDARRLLDASGLASPAISPDGRSIAYLASMPGAGQQLWTVSADGSRRRLVGALSQDGVPVASARSLIWSPDGARLALTTPNGPSWSIWTLELSTGAFTRLGSGGPTPFWLGRQLVRTDVEGRVSPLSGRRVAARRLSRLGDVAGAAVAQGWWVYGWEKDTAVLLRESDGTLTLGWRRGIGGRGLTEATPPHGYVFDPTSRLAVAENGPVAVALLDAEGGRDLGLFDPGTNRWTVLDDAWDPAWSPAPISSGPIEAQEAVGLARDVLASLVWRADGAEEARLLMEGPIDSGLIPMRRGGSTIGPPVRVDDGWIVPSTVHGEIGETFAARSVEVVVRPAGARLAATPRAAGPLVEIRSIDDAVALLQRTLTVEVVAPVGLPSNARLASRAIDAWTWAGVTSGNLNVVIPGTGRLTFFYGSGGFGCGPKPEPTELASGTPAIVSDPEQSGGYNVIAWPARPRDTSAPFGIAGEVPAATLFEIANATDRARLAAGESGSR